MWKSCVLFVSLICFCVNLGCRPGPIDLESVREAVRQADVDFDLACAAKDRDRWAELVADDAVFFGGSGTIEGREAVVAAWAPTLDPDGPATLRWQPVAVEVSGSGDLGYTRGNYQLTVRAEDGSESESTGSYVSIWRKSAEDGKWRAVLDIGTPPEEVV
jgi:ketosteroid isomerase-like protein